MTNKETLIKEIREKVIAAVPEIVELKFGCEVLLHKAKRRFVWDVERSGNYEDAPVIRVDRFGGTEFFPSEYEIIGRPIRLDDCALLFRDRDEKLELVTRWKNGYLDDQTDGTVSWIINNFD